MREVATSVEENEVSYGTADHRPQWFAAYTMPRHEKHVQELLTERGIENFLPLYRTTRQWKKSCPAVLDLPLFPTYVFVRIAQWLGVPSSACQEWCRLSVRQTNPGPCQIPRWRRCGSEYKRKRSNPTPYLKFGERVRIKSGLMTGVEGILIRKKNEFRVVLTLDTIMRSVAVEVDVDDIELASPLVPDSYAIHRLPLVGVLPLGRISKLKPH